MGKSQGRKRQGAKLYKQSDTIYIKFGVCIKTFTIYAFTVKMQIYAEDWWTPMIVSKVEGYVSFLKKITKNYGKYWDIINLGGYMSIGFSILYTFLSVKIDHTKNTKITENKTTGNRWRSGDNEWELALFEKVCSFRLLSPLSSGTPSLVTHIALVSRILFLLVTHICLMRLVASEDIHLDSWFATGFVPRAKVTSLTLSFLDY